ncbi:citron Rho-interacting kinase-like isoform X3 [Dendronephthya gigantea]|uniref:citron Rho-interacting kinase-like isoform X3 n=1 Tax=Dendronephthya gigantea TaxID=151771 RepID=UPI00106BBD29|nr:citron Rho-interacting kinase-like isoform X3 [Dendronephthya gigantea]
MAREPISVRSTQLKEVLNENRRADERTWQLSNEALLDGFIILFDECSSEHLQKDKHVVEFVKKYKNDVMKLRDSRPSISDFKVISIIGRGHFGQVQVVKELQTNNVYALKTLKKSEMLSQENVAFFEEEKEIMAYSGSPWITSLQYAFQDSQNLYLIMEFHPGGDLLTLLGKQENETLDEKIAKFYLAEMVIALNSLHELGYVHRDVKPDNILIDKNGHIKLADFGSAAKLSKTDRKVYSKMAVGTPEYISPEVLTSMEGSGDGYGVECDWWSLGVVAYEMMYGNTPFTGNSVAFTYSKIMNFKESLSFPTGFKATAAIKGLIRGLLTDLENRFGFEHLLKHSFFKDVKWSSLATEQPPYIPTIAGVDDTSNFDEFDPEEDQPTFGSKTPMKKAFSGKNLPFIGFTFTKSDNQNVKCEATDHVENGVIKQEERDKNVELEDDKDGLMKMVKELQTLLKQRKDALENVENEKDLLQKEKLLKETEVKDLEKRLDEERTERLNADKNAVKLMAEVEDMRTKARNLRKEETRAAFDEQQAVLTQLEEDRFVAMKRTQRLEDDLSAQKKLVDEKDVTLTEMRKTVVELEEQLEESKQNADSQVVQEAILQCQEKERSDVKKMREKLKQKIDECCELEKQLLNSKSLKRKLESSEDKLSKAEKEKTLLDQAVKNMEKEVEEAYDALEGLKRKSASQEKTCRENETELAKQKEDLENALSKLTSTSNENEELRTKISKLNESVANMRNTQETMDKELADKQKVVEKIKSESENRLKSNLELKCKELNDAHVKEKKLQEDITTVKKELTEIKRIRKELEEEVVQKESLIENLLKNELAVKTAADDDESCQDMDKKDKEKIRLNDEIIQLKEKCEQLIKDKESLEKNILKQSVTIEEANNKLSKEEQLKQSLRKDSEEIQDLKAEIVVMNNENINLKTKTKDLQTDLRITSEKLSHLRKQSEAFDEQLTTKSKNIDEHQQTIEALKTTCSMLEGQIEELEILNDELDERNVQLEIEKKQLLLSNEKYEKRLEQELRETGNQENDDQLGKCQKLIEEYKQTISEQKTQIGRSELNLKSLERKMEKELTVKECLLEEVEQQKKTLSSLETDKTSLEQELQELRDRQEEMLTENSAMTEHLEMLKSLHAEEKVKLVSTSAQQSKLIDFLQSKAESKTSKWKRLGVSNLINSRKQHSDDNNFIPCQWSELQQALEKERATRTQIQQEMNKVTEELQETQEKVLYWKSRCHLTPNATVARSNQSSAVISAIQQSPSQQPSPGSTLTPSVSRKRKNSSSCSTHRPKERMHHNIPHRFTVVLNMRATRCLVCLDNILFGRQVSKCTECGILCHCKCSTSLPRTCGLPSQYVEHFSEVLRGSRTETSLLVSPGADACDGKEVCMVGCLKVPRNGSAKNGWDSKLVSLKDGQLVISETGEKNSDSDQQQCENVNLCCEENEVKVHSAVAGSDLLGAAATDLPYVFSIEIHPQTTCWPGRTLFLLAPSFPEKQRWIRALENAVDEKKSKSLQNNEQKINGNLLLGMKGDECLDINTTGVLNDKFVLLGCEEGLFVLPVAKPGQENRPRQIPGVKNVYQIKIEKHLGVALLISGIDRELLSVDLKQLEACTKQSREVPLASLDFQTVGNITNCHLFASRKVEDGTFLCAALPNKISILRFNSSMNCFVTRNEIDSSEPCSCIMFSNTKIIVGSNKFYQIDLRQFAIKDYLDCKDPSLAFAVYHASQANSFPVDVLQVSNLSEREEFLLCFNGFGVFVDANGKRTRKDDLKWSGLPLSFAYQEPYLYVTHFNSIEICQIPDLDKETISRKFAEITRPRILGPAISPGAIYLVSTVMSDEISLLCYQGNLTPVLSNAVTNSSESDGDQKRLGRKRLRTATGSENEPPPSFSAFSKDPKRFLRNSLRR